MLRPGHIIALCALALLMLGVVMVNSAGMGVTNIASPDQPSPNLTLRTLLADKTIVYAFLSMLAMTIACFMPWRSLGDWVRDTWGHRPTAWLIGGTVVLMALLLLVYAPVIGVERNGSHRWIGPPSSNPDATSPLTLQPSEFAKWGLILVVALYVALVGPKIREFWAGLVPALLAIGAVSGLVIVEDLGTGTLLLVSSAFVLLAGGARVLHFAMFVPVGVVGFIAAVVTNPYRLDRITAFLNPYQDAEGTGYHMIQSMVAVANGEGFGRGLGHGLQKFGYLPEDQTDFVFAVLCEELGIAGAAVVVAVFLTLLLTGFAIVRRENELWLKLAGLGVLCTIGFQALINMAVVTGLGPTKGIALPLVSSGGTGWILTSFSLGILLAIDRAHAKSEEVGVHDGPQKPLHSAPQIV